MLLLLMSLYLLGGRASYRALKEMLGHKEIISTRQLVAEAEQLELVQRVDTDVRQHGKNFREVILTPKGKGEVDARRQLALSLQLRK